VSFSSENLQAFTWSTYYMTTFGLLCTFNLLCVTIMAIKPNEHVILRVVPAFASPFVIIPL
jgi:hypothetical protein